MKKNWLAVINYSILTLSLFLSSTAGALTVRNFDILDVDDKERWLTGRDNSTINLYDGADVSSLTALNNSRVNMYGGQSKFIKTFGSSQLNITGGSVSTMWLWGQSSTTIKSADVSNIWTLGDSSLSLSNMTDLSNLYVFGDGQIRLEATDVQLNGQMLTGYWESGNAFSIRAISLAGNDKLFNNVSVISPVPVPAAAWMFATALISLTVVGRKRKIGIAA